MTGMLIIVAFLLTFLLGGFPAWCLLARRWPGARVDEWLLVGSLAFPLGAGIVSLIHVALMPLGVVHPAITAILALLLGSLCWPLRPAWRSREVDAPEPPHSDSAPVFPLEWILQLVAVASVVAMLAAVFILQRESPHGAWDAWAIWNVRAKFLAGGEAFWRNALDTGFQLSHPEYPLLSSSFIAWAWKLSGVQSLRVPQLVAILNILSLVGVTYSAIALLRGRSLALLAAMAVIAPVALVPNGAAMYADVPIAALLSVATALLLLAFASTPAQPCALLAGASAGLCGWAKMEGLIYFAALTGALVLISLLNRTRDRQVRARLLSFLAGALPVICAIAVFRLKIASVGVQGLSAIEGQSGSALALVLDTSRYAQILSIGAEIISLMGPWWAHPLLFLALPLLMLQWRGWRTAGAGALVVSLAWVTIWAGYFIIYLLNDQAPSRLMPTSFDRLVLHPWGMLVMLVFVLARSLEDWATVQPSRQSKRERKEAQAQPASDSKPVRKHRGR